MSLWLRRGLGLLIALVLSGLSSLSHAQTSVQLSMTSSTGLTATPASGWSIVFAPLNTGSCLQVVENPSTFSNSAAADCTGVTMVEQVANNQLSLTFQNTNNLLGLESAVGSSSTACSGSACFSNYSDTYLRFTVTAPTGVTISKAQLGLTGTATLSGGAQDLVATDLAKITAGISSNGNLSNLTTNDSASPNQVSAAFASAVNSFSIVADLKVNGNGATAGSTLTFNSAQLVLSPPAPEPISISLFGVGVAGLAAARRRRRR